MLISASAIGYYGTQNHKYIDEKSSYADDFTHKLCDLWESEARNKIRYMHDMNKEKTNQVISNSPAKSIINNRQQ